MRARSLLSALLLVALMLPVGRACAEEDEAPAEVVQVFRSLRSLWRAGDAEGLAEHFGDRVGLYLDDQANNTFSRKQAPAVLRAYFGRTEISEMEHKKYRGQGSSWSEVIRYEYRRTGDSEAVKGTLTLQIQQVDGRWLLDSARVGQ
jgi:hypothetical protein